MSYDTYFANKIGVLQDPFKKNHGLAFEATKIRKFMRQAYPVKLDIVWGQASALIEVYEFEPLESVHVITWHLDENNEYKPRKTSAAPIALETKAWANDHNSWAKIWLDGIVQDREAMKKFGDTCYSKIDGPLQNLFVLFMKYNPKDEKEVCLLDCSHCCNYTNLLKYRKLSLKTFTEC
jgi:hypothetical protein